MSKETSSIVEALAGTRLFTSLPDSVLEELSSLFVERSFEEDEAIFHQGDVGEALLIIKSGQARVEREIMDGRRVILALRGPGAVLGEMALLDGSPRSASVYAQEASTALSLARSSFFRFLTEHGEAFQSLIAILCQRLRESDQKIEDLGSKSLLERLAGGLLKLAETEGTSTDEGVELSATVDYQLLAGLMCTNRESVSRGIRELKKSGLLDKKGRLFLLKDLQGLSDLYEGL